MNIDPSAATAAAAATASDWDHLCPPPRDPTQEELSNLEENLESAGDVMLVPNDADPFDIAPPARTLDVPGEKKWLRPENAGLFDEVTKELLISENHKLPIGDMKEPWETFYDSLFLGPVLADGRRVPGIMNRYKLYTCKNPEAKFRSNLWKAVETKSDHYRASTIEGKLPTELERRCYTLVQERAKALMEARANVAAEAAADPAARKRAENEEAERLIGLRVEARGANAPGSKRGRYPNALTQLGKKTGAIDSRRSRAEAERAIAEAAAMDCESIKYGPGEKERVPRNKDATKRIDDVLLGTTKAQEKSAEAFEKVLTALAPPVETPTKKKQRNYKELSEHISLLIKERKELLEAGMDTSDVDDQIKIKQRERKALNEARPSGTNLGPAFSDSRN